MITLHDDTQIEIDDGYEKFVTTWKEFVEANSDAGDDTVTEVLEELTNSKDGVARIGGGAAAYFEIKLVEGTTAKTKTGKTVVLNTTRKVDGGWEGYILNAEGHAVRVFVPEK